jgi:alkanesulfonate monooxygenase SsuD/methylene tetrahydromethanopterin reductase-like flavin-dependent oxidoreductase (luciferase family)
LAYLDKNIVTSWADTAARAVGLDALPEHDERYVMADEYLELVYKSVPEKLMR